MRKITIANFFEDTLGTFKFIGEAENNAVNWWEWSGGRSYWKKWPQYKQRDLIQKLLNLSDDAVKDWKHNYSSISSWYWHNAKTNQLIRISNHWSFSNSNNVNTCRSIRSCYWELYLHNKRKHLNTSKFNFQVGIIKINKLSNWFRHEHLDDFKTSRREYYVKNNQTYYC